MALTGFITLTLSNLFQSLLYSPQIHFLLVSIPRLLVTTFLCGIIGMEREHVNRPAGVRTHVLVGVSSALIMVTSEYMVTYFQDFYTIDPTRMGAQIISGIGFLGAGTIIKDGFHVRGLTTAASLWAVTCIGIAAGAGFYSGAFLATIAIYLTLEVLKKYMLGKTYNKILLIRTVNLDHTLDQIQYQLERAHIHINQMELLPSQNDGSREIRLQVSVSSKEAMVQFALEQISAMEEVLSLDMEQ